MKLKKHKLRKMILAEMRIMNGRSSPMKSRAHPDLVRALKGESVDRPNPHSVRNIILGLDQALSMPPTAYLADLGRQAQDLSTRCIPILLLI